MRYFLLTAGAALLLAPAIALASGNVTASTTIRIHGTAVQLFDATGRPTWLPSPQGTVPVTFVPAGTSFQTIDAATEPPLGLTDVTGRPTWLPSPMKSAREIFAPFSRTSFETVASPQVPAFCSDPNLDPLVFVMDERLGICPAPRLSTRYRW